MRQKNVLSKEMIDKAAESGLTFRHLQVAFLRDNEEGVKSVLSENFDGKPRVTKRKNIE